MSVENVPTEAERMAAILMRAERDRTLPPLTHLGIMPRTAPAPVELEPVRHAYPAEPVVSEVITTDSFPGLGVDPTEPIDWYALNAYAELVGWRCRFLPLARPFHGARILHPGDELFDVAASLSYSVDPRPRDGRGELIERSSS